MAWTSEVASFRSYLVQRFTRVINPPANFDSDYNKGTGLRRSSSYVKVTESRFRGLRTEMAREAVRAYSDRNNTFRKQFMRSPVRKS